MLDSRILQILGDQLWQSRRVSTLVATRAANVRPCRSAPEPAHNASQPWRCALYAMYPDTGPPTDVGPDARHARYVRSKHQSLRPPLHARPPRVSDSVRASAPIPRSHSTLCGTCRSSRIPHIKHRGLILYAFVNAQNTNPCAGARPLARRCCRNRSLISLAENNSAAGSPFRCTTPPGPAESPPHRQQIVHCRARPASPVSQIAHLERGLIDAQISRGVSRRLNPIRSTATSTSRSRSNSAVSRSLSAVASMTRSKAAATRCRSRLHRRREVGCP